MAHSTLAPEITESAPDRSAVPVPRTFARHDQQTAALFVGELVAQHRCHRDLAIRLAHHHLRSGRRLAAALLFGKVALHAVTDGEEETAWDYANRAVETGGWRSAAGWLPTWVKAAGNRGVAFLCERARATALHDPRQARELLEIAYRSDPGSMDACLGLLELDRRYAARPLSERLPERFDVGLKQLIAQGRHEAFAAIAARLLEEFPRNAGLLRTLIGIYLGAGERRQAIEYLQRLLAVLPDDDNARTQLARAIKAA